MSTALVRVYPGRPPWIRHDGAWVCLSILDTAYLSGLSDWRASLKDGAQGPRRAYSDLVGRYQRWQHAQQSRYVVFGLKPPSGAETRRRPTREPRPARARGVRYIHWKRQPSHCRKGHALNVATIYRQKNGIRRCRLCMARNANRMPLDLLIASIRLVRVNGQRWSSLGVEAQVALFQQFADWLETHGRVSP